MNIMSSRTMIPLRLDDTHHRRPSVHRSKPPSSSASSHTKTFPVFSWSRSLEVRRRLIRGRILSLTASNTTWASFASLMSRGCHRSALEISSHAWIRRRTECRVSKQKNHYLQEYYVGIWKTLSEVNLWKHRDFIRANISRKLLSHPNLNHFGELTETQKYSDSKSAPKF